MAEGMTPSDVALLTQNDMFGGGNAFFWLIALVILAGGNFGGFIGGGNRDYVTRSDLDSQALQSQVQAMGVQVANQNFEVSQLISQQTNQMLQQNNTNLINAIQGFNSVNQAIALLGQKIDQVSYHMDQCCCEIKTQMLQNRLDDATAKNVSLEAAINNANQSQYILSQLGRFVAWTPSGTQAATGT